MLDPLSSLVGTLCKRRKTIWTSKSFSRRHCQVDRFCQSSNLPQTGGLRRNSNDDGRERHGRDVVHSRFERWFRYSRSPILISLSFPVLVAFLIYCASRLHFLVHRTAIHYSSRHVTEQVSLSELVTRTVLRHPQSRKPWSKISI